eukprot:scaffold133382_cov18-Tisochrysis_lutea.AAC.1
MQMQLHRTQLNTRGCAKTCSFQDEASSGSTRLPAAAGFENCKLQRTYLISRSVNPTFHHQISIPTTNCTKLGDLESLQQKNIIAEQIKWKDPVFDE